MPSITIDQRFCGPPNSGNGGYVCGLLAAHIGASAEITLRAPPPLGRELELIVDGNGAAELRDGATILATGRREHVDLSDIPTASFADAEDAARRTPYDERNHQLPGCFVCGPGRAPGDGLRIFTGPLAPSAGEGMHVVAAPWVPDANLASQDGYVAPEFVWASLDCPTGHAGLGARRLGMSGTEAILLGRMSARVDERPRPGDRCVVVAWPTGRERRKLFAEGALLGADGDVLAVARAIWLVVEREVQLGSPAP